MPRRKTPPRETRLSPEHFNAQGKPKKGFRFKADAERFCIEHGITMNVYKCTSRGAGNGTWQRLFKLTLGQPDGFGCTIGDVS